MGAGWIVIDQNEEILIEGMLAAFQKIIYCDSQVAIDSVNGTKQLLKINNVTLVRF